jgi:hypothetical protein
MLPRGRCGVPGTWPRNKSSSDGDGGTDFPCELAMRIGLRIAVSLRRTGVAAVTAMRRSRSKWVPLES